MCHNTSNPTSDTEIIMNQQTRGQTYCNCPMNCDNLYGYFKNRFMNSCIEHKHKDERGNKLENYDGMGNKTKNISVTKYLKKSTYLYILEYKEVKRN